MNEWGDRDNLIVTDNEAAQRYEARVDDQLAVITYRRLGDRIVFIHTDVPEALEGQGIASTMAWVALHDARAQGLMVIPHCPFVASYIRRHPEYADLVLPSNQTHSLDHQARASDPEGGKR